MEKHYCNAEYKRVPACKFILFIAQVCHAHYDLLS